MGAYAMKTLDEYKLIREFISSQGIQPSIAMLCVPQNEWDDLKYLAQSWHREQDEMVAAAEARLEGLSEEELGQMDREAKEQAEREEQEILFYSSGHKPE